MKHIVRKPYWNFEKEEKWLNEMCAKGLALVDYTWCRYVFEDCEKGEYIYRIELLPKSASHIESMKYIQFLEDTEVEYVTSYMRWIYCRKKASDGEFNLFTDIDSKIKHYQRVSAFWLTLACAELCIGLSNISIGSARVSFANMNTIMGFVLLSISIGIFFIGRPARKWIRILKKQKSIME